MTIHERHPMPVSHLPTHLSHYQAATLQQGVPDFGVGTSCSIHSPWGFQKGSPWANKVWEPLLYVGSYLPPSHASMWSSRDPLPQEHSSLQQYCMTTYVHRNTMFTPFQKMEVHLIYNSIMFMFSLFSTSWLQNSFIRYLINPATSCLNSHSFS